MKKVILLIFILLFELNIPSIFAQINLVPNPSFEDSLGCPFSGSQLNLTTYWHVGFGGIDLFRACGFSGYSVPNNYAGYEFAHNGVSYVAYGFFHIIVHNFREFVEVELTKNLIANKKYYVEFYVSLNDSLKYAIWNIGAYFSANGVYGNSLSQILTYIPQVTNTPGNYITNKNGWTKIKSSFVAIGGEKFITIGNFEDDSVIDTLFVGGSSNSGPYDWRGSCYYLDDVAVYEDTTVGINETSAHNTIVKLYPNPANDEITLVFNKEYDNYAYFEVFDLYGNIVLSKNIFTKNKQETLTVNKLSAGIYLYKIKVENEIIGSSKLIIIR